MASVNAANNALEQARKLLESAHIADDDLARTVKDLVEVRNLQKVLDGQRGELEAKIYAALGEKRTLLSATGEVILTVTPQSRTTIDTKRLKVELPDVAAAYSKTTTFTVMRIA